ncbi:MAG: AMP-binding protein [Clostridia bacterium]|nr:AMP-binding protein [Clostridia bacterium]
MLERFVNRDKFDSYEDWKENFRILIPDRFNMAYDVVDAWAAEAPDKEALLWCNDFGDEVRLTWRELSRLSARYAAALDRLGIRRGDVMMFLLKRRWQFWPLAIACMRVGCPFIPATHLLTSKDVAYRCQAADVRFLVSVCDSEVLGHVDAAMPECSTVRARAVARCMPAAAAAMTAAGLAAPSLPAGWLDWDGVADSVSEADAEAWLSVPRDARPSGGDTMLLYFTSGTTGMPKMVLHDFNHPLGHIITARYWQRLEPTDLHISVSDTGWAKCGWGKFYGQWIVGVDNFIYDMEKFEPNKLLEKLAHYRVTTFCAPPTIYRFLIQEEVAEYDLSSLRMCLTAGEPLQPEVFSRWKSLTGCPITEGFGQTESVVLCANFDGFPIRPGSMGKPSALYDIDLVDDDGNPVPPGTEGSLVVTGLDRRVPPGLFREYYRDPATTASVWHDGRYYTGDVAYKDESGYYWYVGRSDDVIKCSGYRIGPFEVESALQEHPSVLECAVTAVPDPVRGQVVKATIVLARGYEPSDKLVREIQDHVKRTTAPYKYPRIVEFVSELPKTISGKIMRKDIRAADERKE